MKEYIRLTIQEISLRRASIEAELSKLCQTEEMLRILADKPVESISTEPKPSPLKVPLMHTIQVETSVPCSPGTAVHSSKRPESQNGSRQIVKPGRFKGVVPVISHLQGGPTKFRASYWDGTAKKNILVGTFTDELEAAMAVAKGLGDKSEIHRISDLIEHRQNNSAGPVPPKEKPEREKPGSKVSGREKKPNRHSTKKLLHYKGVKPLKPKENGTPRFEGHMRVDGKFKYLGTFNVEELAAAAVMEAEGNKPEAKRLREIAKQKAADEVEQRDINPDKPASRRAAQQAEKSDPLVETPDPVKPVAVTWECNKCGRPHVQIERPKICFKCLKDFGFSRIAKPQNTETER